MRARLLLAAGLIVAGCWPAAAWAANYSTGGALGVSTTNPQPGQVLTVSGSGFARGSTVTIQILSTPQTLATVKADGSGAFNTQVTIPSNYFGSHTLQAVGVTPDGATLVLSTTITIGGANGSGSSGMASTGAEVMVTAIVAAVLIVAGAFLLIFRRRANRPLA